MTKFSLSPSPETVKRTITGIVFGIGLFFSYLYSTPSTVSFILIAMLGFIVFYEWPRFGLPWLTPLYPIGPSVLLILLNHSAERSLLPFLFVVVGCYEAGAYGVGKACGRHKLWSSVSPGKTWEGALGGYFISVFAACLYVYFAGNSSSIAVIFATTLLVVAATLGDLFESYLKRQAHLKDAGSLLPGHGGLLDRLDGILGAVLVLYPLRSWFAVILGIS